MSETEWGTKLSRKQLFCVMKIAEVCNLKCPYCYFFFRGDDSHEDDPARMDMSTVRATARFLAEGAEKLGMERVDISLHGGEPLMVGKRRFLDICQALKSELHGRIEMSIGVQTNAVLIDDEWADIFKQNRIGIGISIDGPPEFHDKFRIDKKGRGTYDQTLRGIEALRRKGHPFGVICVLSPELDPLAAYDHIVNVLRARAIDFLYPIQDWEAVDEQTTAKVMEASRAICKRWIEDNDPSIDVRLFSERFRALLSDAGAQRRTLGLKDVCDSITVRSNGDLCPDDTLSSTDPRFRHTGHNVHSSDIASFYASEMWTDLRRSVSEPAGTCADCKWWGACRGGELENRYARSNGFSNPSTYCAAYKDLFSTLYDYASTSFDPAVIDDRLQRIASF